jgi:hypothetical protein
MIWLAVVCVAAAGAVGGLTNSLLSGALPLPQVVAVNGASVFVPGLLGNALIGAVASVLSFALYGPVSVYVLLQDRSAAPEATQPKALLTLGALAAAMLVGFTGGRWLSAEADRSLNHATAAAVARLAEQTESRLRTGAPAAKPKANGVLRAITTATPLEAYRAAEEALAPGSTVVPESP